MNKFKFIAIFIACNSIASSWATMTANCEYGVDGATSIKVCCRPNGGGKASWMDNIYPRGTPTCPHGNIPESERKDKCLENSGQEFGNTSCEGGVQYKNF